MKISRLLRLISVFAIVLGARELRAQPREGLDLRWRAPPGCPSRETVERRIHELLGESSARATHLHVNAEIVRRNGRYRLTLQSRDDRASDERIIEGDSCSDLGGAAAVAIGLLIRIELQSRGAEPSGGPSENTATPAERAQSEQRNQGSAQDQRPAGPGTAAPGPARREAPPREPARGDDDEPSPSAAGDPPDAAPVRFVLRAPLIGVDLGPLPELRPTLGVGVGLRFPNWDVSLGARLGRAQTISSSAVPRRGAELTQVTLDLQGCYRWAVGSFEVGPCAHVALDRVTARGFGDQVNPRDEQALIFAAGGAGLGRWRISESVGLIVSIGAQVEASRPRLVVGGLGELEQLSAFAILGKSGAEWTW